MEGKLLSHVNNESSALSPGGGGGLVNYSQAFLWILKQPKCTLQHRTEIRVHFTMQVESEFHFFVWRCQSVKYFELKLETLEGYDMFHAG